MAGDQTSLTIQLKMGKTGGGSDVVPLIFFSPLMLFCLVVAMESMGVIPENSIEKYGLPAIKPFFEFVDRHIWPGLISPPPPPEEEKGRWFGYILELKRAQSTIRHLKSRIDAGYLEKNGPVCHPIGNGMEMCIQPSPQIPAPSDAGQISCADGPG